MMSAGIGHKRQLSCRESTKLEQNQRLTGRIDAVREQIFCVGIKICNVDAHSSD